MQSEPLKIFTFGCRRTDSCTRKRPSETAVFDEWQYPHEIRSDNIRSGLFVVYPRRNSPSKANSSQTGALGFGGIMGKIANRPIARPLETPKNFPFVLHSGKDIANQAVYSGQKTVAPYPVFFGTRDNDNPGKAPDKSQKRHSVRKKSGTQNSGVEKRIVKIPDSI